MVSIPSWDLFEHQDQSYRDQVLPPDVTARVAVEKAAMFGWAQYAGPKDTLSACDSFGGSAPLKDLQKKFGFTVDAVIKSAREQVSRKALISRARAHKPVLQKVQEMIMNPVGTLETTKAANPLTQLQTFGQSIWLDYIRRDLFKGGELQRLIDRRWLARNDFESLPFSKKPSPSPTHIRIFLTRSPDRADLDAKGRYELLAIRDIQDAADLLVPVYKSTKSRDGYVSLEVSPYLATIQTALSMKPAGCGRRRSSKCHD